MVKGYQESEVRQKLIEILQESKTGLSGIEVAEKLGINRVTMTKYLNVFAVEGLVKQKSLGNVNLWFVEEGTEQFSFPEDYFRIKTKYLEFLVASAQSQAYNLIRNCVYTNADNSKIMTEIIIPAIESVEELYQQGKIGKSEHKLLDNIISRSIQILNLLNVTINSKKNTIVLSADAKSVLQAEAASTSFYSEGWQVSMLGDMTSAIDVLFDLDLQKLLGKIWKQKNGIMIVVIFSQSEEGFKFFSEAVNSVKEKVGKKLFLVLCGKIKKQAIKADLVTENFESALQWSQTTYENYNE